jgi:hypothetical protein
MALKTQDEFVIFDKPLWRAIDLFFFDFLQKNQKKQINRSPPQPILKQCT